MDERKVDTTTRSSRAQALTPIEERTVSSGVQFAQNMRYAYLGFTTEESTASSLTL